MCEYRVYLSKALQDPMSCGVLLELGAKWCKFRVKSQRGSVIQRQKTPPQIDRAGAGHDRTPNLRQRAVAFDLVAVALLANVTHTSRECFSKLSAARS